MEKGAGSYLVSCRLLENLTHGHEFTKQSIPRVGSCKMRKYKKIGNISAVHAMHVNNYGYGYD